MPEMAESTYSGQSKLEGDRFDPEDYMPKEWVDAKGHSCGERLELCVFRAIFWFPVFVTFALFTFLVSFYAYVSTFNNLLF